MTFEEVKSAILGLSEADQKRVIMEVVPQIWPKACVDESCLLAVKDLVDEAAVKKYREQHMGHI